MLSCTHCNQAALSCKPFTISCLRQRIRRHTPVTYSRAISLIDHVLSDQQTEDVQSIICRNNNNTPTLGGLLANHLCRIVTHVAGYAKSQATATSSQLVWPLERRNKRLLDPSKHWKVLSRLDIPRCVDIDCETALLITAQPIPAVWHSVRTVEDV